VHWHGRSTIVFEPGEPVAGRFWAEAVGWPLVYDQDGDTAIRAPDGEGPFFTFGPPGGDILADPDGNEFCVLTPR
jgi:hypothetical protein